MVILQHSCWYEKDTEDVAPTDYVGPLLQFNLFLEKPSHSFSGKQVTWLYHHMSLLIVTNS
ncbi:predicted protein [Sclerotinia sclerotiorum 1980 UF-70]|uniref:Uncharacterized protein n=1 Tax=Sclerotinia sclerotiorum (strain ATCC 18683 / 1980 / Ss-1) TaxID=665079 RepID=A7ERH2_SCLS1|nr:predicted protein [Sclerotinia sclerotiorum 1980 UF-70]EDN92064.1 predicted protein [Sclerotinia sclerotiorum 1980 UF-70]